MKILHFTLYVLLFSTINVAYSSDELTQSQLNQAALQNYKSSDFMLNKAYTQLMEVLDKERQEKLKISQKAWIKFRDLDAGFISSKYTGGSIEPLVYSQALINLTEQRTAELTKNYLNAITP